MPDIITTTTGSWKTRARIISADNEGVSPEQKGARFFISLYRSNADGSKIARTPTVEVEKPFSLPALLADPEIANDVAIAMAALDRIGGVMCARYEAELLAKVNDFEEPQPQPEETP